MTIKEKIQHQQPNEIRLYKEGVFWNSNVTGFGNLLRFFFLFEVRFVNFTL